MESRHTQRYFESLSYPTDKCQVVPLQSIKSKMLKVFLDIVILNEMTNRSGVSIPSIVEFLVRKYGIFISAGTIYPVFYRLEKRGYIVKLPNRLTQLYAINASGKKMLESIQQNIEELQSFLSELLKSGDE